MIKRNDQKEAYLLPYALGKEEEDSITPEYIWIMIIEKRDHL